MSTNVDHPSHYNRGKIEVIDFIEDQSLNFHLGNAVKYICRAGIKNPTKEVEDLEKAIWYIQRYIKETAKPAIDNTVAETRQKILDVLSAASENKTHFTK